jgi:hypothetical protein
MEQKPVAEGIGSEKAVTLSWRITCGTREAREEIEVPLTGPPLFASFLFSFFLSYFIFFVTLILFLTFFVGRFLSFSFSLPLFFLCSFLFILLAFFPSRSEASFECSQQAYFLRRGVVSPTPNPQAGGPPHLV